MHRSDTPGINDVASGSAKNADVTKFETVTKVEFKFTSSSFWMHNPGARLASQCNQGRVQSFAHAHDDWHGTTCERKYAG